MYTNVINLANSNLLKQTDRPKSRLPLSSLPVHHGYTDTKAKPDCQEINVCNERLIRIILTESIFSPNEGTTMSFPEIYHELPKKDDVVVV